MTKTLHILGTASQQPTRHRSHNGYFVRWGCHQATPEGLLFDPGDGSQRQLIFAEISPADITKIFLTHGHGDHTLGLPGVVQGIINATQDFEKTLEIYYPAAMQTFFHHLMNCCAYKTRKLKIVPRPIEEEGVVFESNFMRISARYLKHRMPTLGYRIEDKTKTSMFGDKLKQAGITGRNISRLLKEGIFELDGMTYRLEDFSETKPGKSFAFVMDTVPCEGALRLAENADLAICESTYLTIDQADAEKNGHMTAAQAAHVAKQANAKKLVLTHFSQRYPHTIDFYNEAKDIFPDVSAANDLDIFTF